MCFTSEGADVVLLNAKIARALKNSNKRKEVRKYGDCKCGHWHVTSRDGSNDGGL